MARYDFRITAMIEKKWNFLKWNEMQLVDPLSIYLCKTSLEKLWMSLQKAIHCGKQVTHQMS